MADTMEFVKELKALVGQWRHARGPKKDAVAAVFTECANDLEGLIEGWGFVDPFEAEAEGGR